MKTVLVLALLVCLASMEVQGERLDDRRMLWADQAMDVVQHQRPAFATHVSRSSALPGRRLFTHFLLHGQEEEA